jgi:hypothetical protein
MAYYADVEFIDESNPELVETNAMEFRRMNDLLTSAKPTLTRVKEQTEWEGAGRDRYDSRLADAAGLAEDMASAFSQADRALAAYAPRLEEAKRLITEGQVTERRLAELVGSVADAITAQARAAEPMRQWEDISATTGVLDWFAELGMDVDSIRDEAQRAYDQTNSKFEAAKQTEEKARKLCLEALQKAYDSLPDFRANSKEAAAIVDGIPDIEKEGKEAADDPNVRIPGTGEKKDYPPGSVDSPVSPELADIRNQAGGLEGGNVTIPAYKPGETSDEYRANWIKDNQEVIKAAAREYGLPPEVVAGIAWQEVAGEPYWTDKAVYDARRAEEAVNQHLDPNDDGRSNATSMGPIAIQVRRAAETLGYDPETMTDDQRDEVVNSLQDPKQNIFIAAKHIADLKQETDFKDAETMTSEQYQELAARYNGGPYWQSSDAQGYGRAFTSKLPQAREALGS